MASVGAAGKLVGRAIDFSRFLRMHFQPSDFVVVKMDVEGAEHRIIPKLIADGTIALVDELFVECHYFLWSWIAVVRNWTWPDCLHMYQGLRDRGIYAHEWA
eukprot:TRINITY_DN7567_c0_g1_i2.p2 TRINITY_DN7567_c0_g1~~TRINITY_DN7567_c0_g1_i2.p2  ORF type:complete len:102 (+),score=22.10 TRINITY_DN7567_c0_g1_i2:438-743(+)